MIYEQIQPPESLRNYVRYFWRLESLPTDTASRTFRTIVDGSPGLMVHQLETGTFHQHNEKLPPVFLYGQATQYTELHYAEKIRTIGVYFYPHALKSVFGMDAHELTDSCIDVGRLPANHGSQLAEKLVNQPSATAQIQLLSAYLHAQIRQNRAPTDHSIQLAISGIIGSSGRVSLKELQQRAQLSERSFERRFKQSVGLSPKLFARIRRFQASLAQMRTHNFDKLSDIAFENEYADQSHFIRSFKEFAGLSPNQYQKQANELIENFPELIK